ncbi:helix-turn-helix transcriptional regulator [Sandarakinorhabdus oryzae]|uniref:helix-turn-helix transcriptional regulator n=1 Tax=Sandarakinorhabdus oryzae TaxID=2675220 RepID=UPI0018CC32B5|nr:AraC family transcriptional regulator [Sandarakinorhabdus oryzae]
MILGKGRIMVWEGASFWLLEATPVPEGLRPHAHHAIQVTFCVKGGFEIGVAGATLAGPVSIVDSDVRHDFRASGAVAFLFIAPESAAGRSVRAAYLAEKPWTNVQDGPLVEAIAHLRACLDRGCPADEVREAGRRLEAMLATADARPPADPRVLAMIVHARQRLGGAVTLPSAAAAVHLSPSRARHLFAAATGLPFKTYVLWLRLEQAVAHMAAGLSLTEAAHEAGFADSAHFSRTFRRTFGLPAAGLRLYRD